MLGNAPQTTAPGVLPAAPTRPPVAGLQPIPPVAAAVPRPAQTPSVLPVAGQASVDLPRWAALVGLGLVGSGLGLRLRDKILGRDTTAHSIDELESDVADTDLTDRP
ncbi:MAG: hypothetical protein IT305_06955 [Chloroflexi bacterium]|nr:hypothetical protein [Chloroflexota bacterium]